MDQLKSNPNPKKWWECIKQLAGYPKKKVFSSLVWDNEIINGEVLVNKINDAFTATTQEMSPLKQHPTETQFESSQYLILPEYIIREESIYKKIITISSYKSSGPDETPN
jgi:hypothetical protein